MGDNMKKQISVLIKPSSSKCNLKCKYCFYHDVSNKREVKDYGFMEEETAKKLIDRAFQFVGDDGVVSFAFQGGEPTLIGLEFYKTFVSYVNLTKNNITIHYSFQTNGIVIDEKWANFFKENNFLIGLSIDGTKEIHNINRVDSLGKDTFKQVLQTAKLFDKIGVQYNVLTVVTKGLAKKINSVYSFYKKHNFNYLQFIPCIDNFGEEMSSYSLTTKQYSEFLIQLFNLWFEDAKNNNRISIRFFDNILRMYLGMPAESCDMRGFCSFQHVVESNGDVYPCDFYVVDNYFVGNIKDISFDEMHKKEISQTFIKESVQANEKCEKCKYYKLCRNGCKRHRVNNLGDEINVNKYCEAYYEFYSSTNKQFYLIANLISTNKIR